MTPPSTPRYDRPSQALHWITAIVVTIGFVLGPEHFGRLVRQGLDPATRLDIVWHESLGVLVAVLTLARLAWVAVRAPAPVIPMPAWMHLLARIIHLAFWGLLLALPATALLALGSEGHPLTLLGGVRIDRMPLIAGSAIGRAADWGEIHGVLGDVIMWLAGVHAAAAIYHHVRLKDGVLRSMLPKGGITSRTGARDPRTP